MEPSSFSKFQHFLAAMSDDASDGAAAATMDVDDALEAIRGEHAVLCFGLNRLPSHAHVYNACTVRNQHTHSFNNVKIYILKKEDREGEGERPGCVHTQRATRFSVRVWDACVVVYTPATILVTLVL